MTNDFNPPEPPQLQPVDRPYLQPHRGQTVMILGILSFFVVPIILGPMAWIMGKNDLKEMDDGHMDPRGRGDTNTGRICGMISTIICAVSVGMFTMVLFCCMGGPLMVGLLAPDGPSRNRNPAPINQAAPDDFVDTDVVIGPLTPGHRETRCPHCNQRLEYPERFPADSQFRCDNCNRQFKGVRQPAP